MNAKESAEKVRFASIAQPDKFSKFGLCRGLIATDTQIVIIQFQ